MNPFFIVGSGRSGTTLLRTILNASPEIYIPPECDFLARSFPFFERNNRLGLPDYPMLAELFMCTAREGSWRFKREEVLEVLQDGRPETLSEVNERIYEAYLDRHGYHSSQWGIKTPDLVHNIREIRCLFPKAKIIHIVRDGRDVFLSFRKIHADPNIHSFGPRNVLEGALNWVDRLRQVHRWRDELKTDLIEVRYEDLLSDPARTTESVCKFLGIRYSEEMWKTYHHSGRMEKLSRRFSKHQPKLLKGIDAANVNNYGSCLSPSEIRLFDFITEPYLRQYAYRCSVVRNGYLDRIARKGLYGIARVFNNTRYWIRDHRTYRKAAARTRAWMPSSSYVEAARRS